jgi:hypothetical protein
MSRAYPVPVCLVQREAEPGDHFPPTCNEPRGHCGPHRGKWLTYAGKPFLRELWIDPIPVPDLRMEAA